VRFNWLNKLRLHILRKFNTSHNVWPELKWRRLDQRGVERHVVTIVMQESAATTVPRIAERSDPGAALAPIAGTADVIAGWIGKKDICASVSALGSTL
jgi:hypothetical protein